MKIILLALISGFLLIAVNLYAESGDVFVEGNLGVGTTTAGARLDVDGNGQRVFRFKDSQGDGIEMVDHGVSNRVSLYLNDPTHSKSLIFFGGGAGDWNMGQFAVQAKISSFEGGNVGIGTTNPGSYKLYVAGTAYSTGGWQSSDKRFKKDIADIDSPLNKILNIKGVSYNWKIEEYKEKGFPEGRHYGIIGQEIEKILPEIVKEGPEGDKSVAYTEIIPVLIEAMKEQQKVIEKQTEFMKKHQKEIEELKAKVQQLETKKFAAIVR